MKKLFLSLVLGCMAMAGFSQQGRDTIRTSSGLKYVQVKAGDGKKATDGEVVKVKYRGTLSNGIVFDVNTQNIPFKYQLGTNQAIPGWEEGFKLMSKGERGYLFIPSDLAYGSKGVRSPRDPDTYIIPPDTDLIFEVEIVDIKARN